MLNQLLDHRLLFVTGKGGVGKSTITAGLGLLAAQRGKRVLVAEVDAKGDLGRLFESGPLKFNAREVQPGVFAMAMQTEDSLREYLRVQAKVPFIVKLGPLARTLDFVASAAPGVREILTIGKFAWEVRERHYDLVIVDCAASGHIVSQLNAHRAIDSLVGLGPVKKQTQWMSDILSDPAITGTVVVTTGEEMPVTETLELVAKLRAETEISVSAVMVNRVLPAIFNRDEARVFERLQRPATQKKLGPGGVELVTAAMIADTMRESRSVQMARLTQELEGSVPMVLVPELFRADHGLRALHKIADLIGEEI